MSQTEAGACSGTGTGRAKRAYSQAVALTVFALDGYRDRYSGLRLICPPALYALADALPDVLPLAGGRRTSHQVHWDRFPTIDHIRPVSARSADEPANWATTSFTTNRAKAARSFAALGWTLDARSPLPDWDGLVGWYLAYAASRPHVARLKRNIGWHRAILRSARSPGSV